MMYNSDTKEIAKPTELLNSIKAIMNVLQSIENYGMNSVHLSVLCRVVCERLWTHVSLSVYGISRQYYSRNFYSILMKFLHSSLGPEK